MASQASADSDRAEEVIERAMFKFVGTMALLLLVLAPSSFGKKDETLEQLIARAEAARPEQQAELFIEAAERQAQALSDSAKGERWDEFGTQLQQVVKYCDRAQSAAIQSNKKVKRTEIKIRQISLRLRNLKPDVDPDQQAPVQAAVDRLEDFRAQLFRRMFGLKDKSDD